MFDGFAQNRPLMLYAWRGSSVFVVDNEGNTGDLDIAGFYFRQTRYLSRLEFRIDGVGPHLCSAAQVSQNALEFSYIFPEERSGGMPSGYGILTRSLDLRLSYRVHPGSCDIELTIAN